MFRRVETKCEKIPNSTKEGEHDPDFRERLPDVVTLRGIYPKNYMVSREEQREEKTCGKAILSEEDLLT